MVGVGLGGLVLLTTPWVFEPLGPARFDWFPGIGHYPKSLLGTDVELVSNAYPPTVCFLLADIWSIGAVMLLRPMLTRWLERPRPWKATIFLNGVIMTLFLWHMTAYFIVLLALWPLGVGHQQDSTAPGGCSAPCSSGSRRWCSPASWRSSDASNGPSGPRNVRPRSAFKFRDSDADSFRETRTLEGATAWCAELQPQRWG